MKFRPLPKNFGYPLSKVLWEQELRQSHTICHYTILWYSHKSFQPSQTVSRVCNNCRCNIAKVIRIQELPDISLIFSLYIVLYRLPDPKCEETEKRAPETLVDVDIDTARSCVDVESHCLLGLVVADPQFGADGNFDVVTAPLIFSEEWNLGRVVVLDVHIEALQVDVVAALVMPPAARNAVIHQGCRTSTYGVVVLRISTMIQTSVVNSSYLTLSIEL